MCASPSRPVLIRAAAGCARPPTGVTRRVLLDERQSSHGVDKRDAREAHGLKYIRGILTSICYKHKSTKLAPRPSLSTLWSVVSAPGPLPLSANKKRGAEHRVSAERANTRRVPSVQTIRNQHRMQGGRVIPRLAAKAAPYVEARPGHPACAVPLASTSAPARNP